MGDTYNYFSPTRCLIDCLAFNHCWLFMANWIKVILCLDFYSNSFIHWSFSGSCSTWIGLKYCLMPCWICSKTSPRSFLLGVGGFPLPITHLFMHLPFLSHKLKIRIIEIKISNLEKYSLLPIHRVQIRAIKVV